MTRSAITSVGSVTTLPNSPTTATTTGTARYQRRSLTASYRRRPSGLNPTASGTSSDSTQEAVVHGNNSCRKVSWRRICAEVKSSAGSGGGTSSTRCQGVDQATTTAKASARPTATQRGAHVVAGLEACSVRTRSDTGEPLQVLAPVGDELLLRRSQHGPEGVGRTCRALRRVHGAVELHQLALPFPFADQPAGQPAG